MKYGTQLRVSGKSCNNHNLTSIAFKKMVFQLFLCFSLQIVTENYKLIYESQFRHFINSKRPQIFSVIFDLSVLE